MGKTTEMEIKVSGIRITDAKVKVMPNGTIKLIVETPNTEAKATADEMFILVEASKLSMHDKFIKYKPQTDEGKAFKKLLKAAIKKGVKDFYKPLVDPSVDENGKIYFEAGNKPAVGHSYNWWEKKAKEFCPDRGSRLGTKLEYVTFLGVFIKSLIEIGWKVADAWKAVCVDSKELGHYWNSENAKHDFEPTGSREVCGFYDLANAYKILAEDEDEEAGGFWLAGSSYIHCSYGYPLASLGCNYYLFDYGNFSVGWLVLSA